MPTMVPTQTPTAPTQMPTLSPTGGPTSHPTQPTFAPTEAPTLSPTENPTESPTVSPTEQPTASPTQLPTQWPTYEGCPKPDFKIQVDTEGSWLEIRNDLKRVFEAYCHMVDGNWTNYNFEELWAEAVTEERIKVVRNETHYNLFDEEGINKEPFEPMSLHICGPEDWPRTRELEDKSRCFGGIVDPTNVARKNKIAALVLVFLAVFLYSQ